MRCRLVLTLLAMTVASAQASSAADAVSPASAPAATVPAAATSAATAPSHVSVLTGEQVIRILDETVDWYRTLGTQEQNANQPSDLLILFANRQTADKVVGLAFELARANAELLSSEAGVGQSAADTASPQALDQQRTQLEAQSTALQQEINATRLGATGKAKLEVAAKLPELQGELAMVNARKNLLDTMTEFVNESDPKGAGANALKAQIDAIAATLPTSSANPAGAVPAAGSAQGSGGATTSAAGSTAGSNATASSGNTGGAARSGILDLVSEVLKLRNKIETIDTVDRHTADLAATFQKISTVPLEQLKSYAARSDALAKQADSGGSDLLKQLRGQFDTLAWLFKQTSAILIPLTKEQVLLQQYRHNLANWRDATVRQYRDAWQTLGVRLLILAGFLAAVFVLAEVWRRAVLRYVREPRRRYQFLLIRKILLWLVVAAIMALSFVTEISALATFAGLLTAGVAVAMQSVLVSVVGYFFLIGKYGIRVGDRIQIGAVVGEVIELGLVRMHLMELDSQGPMGPTGRVVAFANLIVFQASGGLFKQIPGVNLSWREMSITLPAVSDYAALKDRLREAVTAVVVEYRDEIVRQTKEIERTTDTVSPNDGLPQVQMRLTEGHMEALIRYPVHLKHATEIEERVSAAVLKVIADSASAG
jgi:small-conductance mechanosensitive channel